MKENKNVYYVYTYTDPRNNEVFYVGKGKGRRCFEHIREVENSRVEKIKISNVEKYNLIKDIIDNGFYPLIVIKFKNLSEHQSLYLEKLYIKKYKFKENGGTLLNKKTSNKITQDLSESVSESLKKYFEENDVWNKGKPWDSNTKAKMSKARKRFFDSGGKNWCDGIKMSEEFCKANSEGQKRRFQTQRQHNALYWVTPEGIFDSKKAAAEATGLTEGQIKLRCQMYNNIIPIHNKIKIEISEKYGPDKVGLTWKEIGYYTQSENYRTPPP